MGEHATATLDERYELEHLLGRGGGGRVYRARQRSTGQRVAVKLLDLEPDLSDSARERRKDRFRREMTICGRLAHPDIVGLIDFGELDDSLYSVFELVPGRTLAQVLQSEGSLTLARSRAVLRQLLDVLVYSHAMGVIHRDLKPSNLMILGEPEHERVKVLDFGISAMPSGASSTLTRLTLSNELVGTPAYAAPEQLRGDAPTSKSDIYSWGLIALECLTGSNVMSGFSLGEIFARQLSPVPIELPARLREHGFGTLLRWVLEKDPARRAGSASDIFARFDAISLDDLADSGGYFNEAKSSASQPAARASEPLTGTTPAIVIEGERRQVSALCCRLPLRCAAAHVDPVLLDVYRSDLFALCQSTVESFGGTLVGGFGDLALFYFGVPRAKDTDVRMSMRAALELSAQVRSRSAALQVQSQVTVALQAGLHTGLLTAGERSSSRAFTHGLLATIATTLALHAGDDDEATIAVSDAFRQLADRHGEFSESGALSLRWQAEPLITHHLLGESLSDVFELGVAPMVGRDDELAQIVAAWRDSNTRGRVALIRGEPGMGKSRLAHELGRISKDEGHGHLALRFVPEMQHIALGPLLELVSAELTLGVAPTCATLSAALADFDVDSASAVPLLCAWLAVPLTAPFTPLPHSPQMQRGMLYALLVALLAQLLERRSGYLLVEDLHWADPSTLDWLGHYLAQLDAQGGFVLLTSRAEGEWRWDQVEPLTITLDHLSDTQVSALVAELPAASQLADSVIAKIVERADGVPLFVEELVRALARQPADSSGEAREVPASLRDLLTSRLDELGPAKDTAQFAAAIGREFEFELLRASIMKDEATLLADLDQLVSSGLISSRRRIDRPSYIYRHALLRDAAYESMTGTAHQAVHDAIASALLYEFPKRVEARPDLAALHLELAGRLFESQVYWRRAGENALHTLAYEEARVFLQRGRDIVARCPDDAASEEARNEAELDLLRGLSAAHIAKFGYGTPELVGLLEASTSLVAKLEHPTERVLPPMWMKYIRASIQPDVAAASQIAAQMLAAATSLPNSAYLALGHSAIARIAFWRGDFEACRRHGQSCQETYTEELGKIIYPITGENIDLATQTFVDVSTILSGQVEVGISNHEQLLGRARELQLTAETASLLAQNAWGLMLASMHRPGSDALKTAERLASQAIDVSASLGFPFWLAHARNVLAAIQIFQGRSEGVDGLEQGIAFYRAVGAGIGFSWHGTCLGFGLIDRGDVEAASATLGETRQFVEQSGERFFSSPLARAEARLAHLQAPSSDLVADKLIEAIEQANTQGAALFASQAAADYIELCSGRADARPSVVTQALVHLHE